MLLWIKARSRGRQGLAAAAAVVVIGAVWTVGVVRWPGLEPLDDLTGRGWQSQVAIALASVTAGLVGLLLGIGLVAVQLRSSFSWRVVRGIFDARARVGLLLTVVLGVVFPLVVAASPSAFWTRWAFAAFGCALLSIGGLAWVGMERTAPEWLVERAVRRGLRTATRKSVRSGRNPSVLRDRTEVLVELAASTALNPVEHRRALLAATTMLATVARAEGRRSELQVAAVHQVSRAAIDGRAAMSIARDTVAALTALGIELCSLPAIHEAVTSALAGIAQRARADGHHQLGHEALDGLAETTQARLAMLLSDLSVPELVAASRDNCNARPAPKRMTATADIERKLERVSADQASDSEGEPAHDGRRMRWSRYFVPPSEVFTVVTRAAAEERPSFTEIGKILDFLRLDKIVGDDSAESRRQHRAQVDSDAHDLLQETTGQLAARLAAPRLDTSSWPGGWQGEAALHQDVRRIGGLALAAYRRHRYTPDDTVEKALENIAVSLLADSLPPTIPPTDRTGWRVIDSHDTSDPSSAIGETLAQLMTAAFDAGFDRRALLTGRRLLTTITAAVESGNVTATVSLGEGLSRAIREMTTHQPDRTLSHLTRESKLLAGLLAELDPLLAAAAADSRLTDFTEAMSTTLAWSTNGNPLPLAASVIKAQLRAAGWPIGAPYDPNTSLDDRSISPLPEALVASAEDELGSALYRDDPAYAAAIVASLWANAAAAVNAGDHAPAARLHHLLTGLVKERDGEAEKDLFRPEPECGEERSPGVRPLDKQLHRIAVAAMQGTATVQTPRRQRTFPRARGKLQNVIQEALADPGFADRTYRGLRRDGALVVVEESDGSRRLLRDVEVRARAQFEWGYGGNGPYTLADVLTIDVLADLASCPTCLGAAPWSVRVVRCLACKNTGRRPDVRRIQLGIYETVCSLNRSSEDDVPPWVEWQLTRRVFLEQALRSLS